MKLDLQTLAFILGLTFITLVLALWVQYRVNRTYRGVGWWLLGSMLTALGFIFLAVSQVRMIGLLGILGNPLLMAGRLCILVGVARFLDWKVALPQMASLLALFVVLYYIHLFVHPNVSIRTITVSAAIALFSFMTAWLLLARCKPEFRGAAQLTAGVFLAHGCFLVINIFSTLRSPAIESYLQFSLIQKSVFIVPIVTSVLWTFGLILTVNQRLNAENIAEQRKLCEAMGALRESEAIHRSILEASPDAITITDPEGKVLSASPSADVMFGYGPGEGLQGDVIHFLAPEDHTRARANLRLLIQGNLKGPHEYHGRRKDQSSFDVEVNSGLILGDQGHLAKLVFVSRDISGRKKAEADKAELEARNRQLQKAESLSRMAGAIAHHFNNKLQSVITNLELMENQAGGPNSGTCLHRARQATEQASEMSRLMMAYLGQTSQEQAPLILARLYRSSLPLLQGGLPPQVTLDADLPSESPLIRGNGEQLQQVFINLVTNAWEAMGEVGGTVHITLGTCPASGIPRANRVPIDWQPQALAYNYLEVTDSGPGIPETDLEKLFDPFFSTRHTGRGMGLPVVLGIVQAHGGGISVESRPGRGSSFRVYLPVCAPSQQQSAAGRTTHPGTSGSGRTLLLVDDDLDLLDSTRDLLEIKGFSVLTAKDGLEALEVFRTHRAQILCVITDLTMPRLDGWGTLAALRQLDPDLPVILTSGYDRTQVMKREHPDLPQAFLGKPFNMKQLHDAVETAMELRS
nr:ATP-binding protein [uncultured Holophaga sp.]